MGIEEGTGKEILGRRNANAKMAVQSYEAGQDNKLKNMGITKVGEIAKKV